MRNFTAYSVDVDCDEEELQMVLEHGTIIETARHQFARVVYGPKTAVVDVRNESVISFFDRDLINEYEYRGGLRCMKDGRMVEYTENHQVEVPKKGLVIGETLRELLDYFDMTEHEVLRMERCPSEEWHHYTIYHGSERSLLTSSTAIGFLDDVEPLNVHEYTFTEHAKERMYERGLLLEEIDHVLKTGKYIIDGTQKWVVVGFVDGKKTKVVIDDERIVTVYTDRMKRDVPRYSAQLYTYQKELSARKDKSLHEEISQTQVSG